jgi:putative ABC transport system permease protein
MTEATKQITGLLRERHHLTSAEDDDFNVRRPEDLIQAQLATSRIMTILLGSVASLSLLIGGIGIMNIMLVSVTQRTREIGVRLAVGATEWDVQLQFLSEAVALSMLGGILGMLAGVLSSAAVEQFFEFPTKLTPEVLAIGGVVAASIGILFGYYPARRASQLDPIQGLRYE